MNLQSIALAALVASAGTIAFAGGESVARTQEAAVEGGQQQDIIETAIAAGSFDTLYTALRTGGLVSALKTPGPFTVFAPTDDAFAKLPPRTLADLLKPENRRLLNYILTYHVVSGEYFAADVIQLSSLTALNQVMLPITVTGQGVYIDSAKLVATDVDCTNGVIHVLDSVMLPAPIGMADPELSAQYAAVFGTRSAFAFGEDCSKTCSSSAMAAGDGKDIVDTAVGAGSFKTLAAALQAAGLVEALKGKGPFTVFAPTDEAFAKLPKGVLADLLKPENKAKLVDILTYHVVAGDVRAEAVVKARYFTALDGQRIGVTVTEGEVSVQGAKVVKTDIACSNGVIHVIDAVIMPPTANIVQTADKAGSFRTLLAAVTAADLRKVLESDGPFTVFAPTDDAFAKLPKGTLENLLLPQNKDQLVALLKNHVVSGRVFADQAIAAGSAKTLAGKALAIQENEGRVTVGGAQVVKADVAASNGVIHVVDSVILAQ